MRGSEAGDGGRRHENGEGWGANGPMKSRSQLRCGVAECAVVRGSAGHAKRCIRDNLLRFTLKANAAFRFNPLIKELSIVVVVEFLACLNIAVG